MVYYTYTNVRKEVQNLLDKALLKYHVNKNGLTLENLSNELGINPSTLNRKMSGESDFTRNEIKITRSYLKLTIEEAESIFFK